MYRVLLAILLLDALVLAAAVLLQAGKGGGLAASFGGAGSSPNSLLGSREASNLLTKMSWWCGGLFMGLAFILQLMASQGRSAPTSVLDETFSTPPTSTAPAPGNPPANTPLTPITPAPTSGKAPTGGAPPKQSEKQPPSGKQQ
jgi:preprotein translocase subunit SecG